MVYGMVEQLITELKIIHIKAYFAIGMEMKANKQSFVLELKDMENG